MVEISLYPHIYPAHDRRLKHGSINTFLNHGTSAVEVGSVFLLLGPERKLEVALVCKM